MTTDLDAQWTGARTLLARPSGRLHLMGIGGAGLSGLAVLLRAAGFSVDGCDASPGRMGDALRALGVRVHSGHDPSHCTGDLLAVIRSAAVPESHPEARRAAERGLPVLTRGVVLAALADSPRCLAVAGTHGKTTTSSMLAQVLDRAGRAPGYCIGGETAALPAPARAPCPGGDLVVEADESDGTLRYYAPGVAVVTNVDFDHMEHFRDEAEFHSVFERFVRQAGRVALGADDPGAARLLRERPDAATFGLGPDCVVRADAVETLAESVSFDLILKGKHRGRARLPVGGLFNVRNALAAFTAAWLAGLDPDALAAGLTGFQPARRRQQRLPAGRGVEVITDYAHHPTEIRALLEALRLRSARRLIALFQPHRYTRTKALGADFPSAFASADDVILLPVYEASESPLPGGTGLDLFHRFERAGAPARWAGDFDAARTLLLSELQPGDLLAVIGAGDVDELGRRIAAELATPAET